MILFGKPTHGQVNTSVELSSISGLGEQAPFWLQSNRSGIYSSDQYQLMARFQLHASHQLSESFSVLYGTDFVNRPTGQTTSHFNQGYLKVRGYGFELAGGSFINTSPIHSEKLSMGSLGVSGNAPPVPQIRIGTVDWIPLPLTQNFIEIRGHAAHGWLGSRRYTDDVLYHEKVAHARFGGDLPVNLYGGLAHYAKWGGNNNPRGVNDPDFPEDLPSGFGDFWRVFFALGGDDSAPPGEEDYMLGDHLGAWDFGLYADIGRTDIKLYRQFPIETKDNLKFKSPQDALTGISFSFDRGDFGPVREILYEHLYTKWQDGPRVENVVDGVPCSQLPPGTCRDEEMGNENYYNHSIYKTGWVHHRQTIGNALFIPRDDNLGVENSRILAHHVGLSTEWNNVSMINKATWSRSSGTWEDPYDPVREQWSFSTAFEVPFTYGNQQFTFISEAAYDRGALVGDQIGLLLGFRWNN